MNIKHVYLWQIISRHKVHKFQWRTRLPILKLSSSSLTLVKALESEAVITEQMVTPTVIHSTANDLARVDLGALSP